MNDIIESLRLKIVLAENNGEKLDKTSWRFQEGILITVNEAKVILEVLQGVNNLHKPAVMESCDHDFMQIREPVGYLQCRLCGEYMI